MDPGAAMPSAVVAVTLTTEAGGSPAGIDGPGRTAGVREGPGGTEKEAEAEEEKEEDDKDDADADADDDPAIDTTDVGAELEGAAEA